MDETAVYRDPPELDRQAVDAMLARNDAAELREAVLAAALHADDAAWAEDVCLRLSAHPDANVRGNAVLGFGHLARIHGALRREAVLPAIEVALRDPDAYVRGQAEAAAGDVRHFLGWRIRRPPDA